MTVRQWIALTVAVFAVAGAFFLWRAPGGGDAEAASQTPVIEQVKVLVAARDVPAGVALTLSDLRWADWPRANLSPAFVTEEAMPNALDEFAGAATRVPLIAGEPVVDARVSRPGHGGGLSALLEPGRRAVAVRISPETASANFIAPNDRVDVLLTRESSGDSGQAGSYTEVIMQNVRVLTIGSVAQRPETSGESGPTQISGDVATLDVSREEATTLSAAMQAGRLSLVLRGHAPEGAPRPTARDLTSPGIVRLHAFGEVTELKGVAR